MTGKSSWVPSRTQGLFSQCCRWHCVSWLLQELLLSRCGWGVSLGQASLVIPIFAFVDRDLAWHCIKLCWKLYLRTYLLPLYLSNSVCNNFYSYSDDEKYLWTLCNMWHVCWILYDLGCCNRLSRPVVVLDGLPGLYGFKYDSATACGLWLYLYSYKLVGSTTILPLRCVRRPVQHRSWPMLAGAHSHDNKLSVLGD